MPGFHADHVGSLLRPRALLDAREAHGRGEIPDEALAAAEDEAIRGVLRLQQEAGVEVYTDGEFRRTSWMSAIYEAAEGLVPRGQAPDMRRFWSGPGADEANSELPIPQVSARERLKLKRRLTGTETGFLARHAPGPFKATMPGPTMYLNLFEAGVSEPAYADREALLEDLVAIYQAEVEAQVRDGAAYVQLDSLRYTQILAGLEPMWGGLPMDQAIGQAVAADNAVLERAKAVGAVTGVHICRGNHRSAWAASGSYEPVAERLFGETAADRLLLEFDDERSGGFEPLRFVPKGKTVVLGLVTTKTAALEDQDLLRRRVDEAARYVDLEYLAISPQCGFASTYLGNLLSEDDEKRKLELVADTARSIWG